MSAKITGVYLNCRKFRLFAPFAACFITACAKMSHNFVVPCADDALSLNWLIIIKVSDIRSWVFYIRLGFWKVFCQQESVDVDWLPGTIIKFFCALRAFLQDGNFLRTLLVNLAQHQMCCVKTCAHRLKLETNRLLRSRHKITCNIGVSHSTEAFFPSVHLSNLIDSRAIVRFQLSIAPWDFELFVFVIFWMFDTVHIFGVFCQKQQLAFKII